MDKNSGNEKKKANEVMADMGISQNYSMEDKSVKENATVIKYYLEF